MKHKMNLLSPIKILKDLNENATKRFDTLNLSKKQDAKNVPAKLKREERDSCTET